MQLNPSATEVTTAATDAAVGLLCLAVVLRLGAIPVNATWKRALWCWVFGLLGLASVLGAVVHGLKLSESVLAVLWWPLYGLFHLVQLIATAALANGLRRGLETKGWQAA